MAGLWPRTGNVTVTNGSKIVTGFGTKWKTGTLPIQKGHTFYGPDNFAYEVDTVVSDESLTLVEAYRGSTLANQAYRIDITRTSTISQFAADLASLVAKYRAWFDGMMTWLTGSGDVAILNPDTGTTTTIPSWKKVASEGEGQAARAKTEADKATASATLAGDIVLQSAMPLPDVWLPLNDDLRMITGFGGDVKVGELTVAKRANFERVTGATYVNKSTGIRVAAAINEPRFEAGGLLIEKASTNLYTESGYTGSNMTSNKIADAVLVKRADPVMGGDYAQLKSVTSIVSNRHVSLALFPATEGLTYTVTVTVRRPVGSPCNRVRFGALGMLPDKYEVDLIEGVAVELVLTGVVDPGRNTVGCFVRPQIGAEYLIAVPADTPLIEVGDVQAEAGNVSTSRIRSAGAQTQRAQDKCWLQELGNMLPLNRDFTLSFTADVQYDPADYGSFYSSGFSPLMSRFLIWQASTTRFYVGSAVSAALTPSQFQAAMPMGSPRKITLIRRGDKSEIWISGVKLATSAGSNEIGFSNEKVILGADTNFARPMPRMHIRDWKVWHFAASDAQAKAIR